jgi:8-oxo-dGTP pyrophosphatase MutT (NUDIX family)
MPRPWKKLGSKRLGDFRIFTIRSDQKVSPRTQKEHDFFVIDSAHWVNVIALTSNRELVMVEQFRHGSNTVELEVPGGMIDPGDASPLAAGARELREETGYEGDHGRIIGEVWPNPAIQSNTCYTALFEHCEARHPQQWDQSEELVTRLISVSEIPQLVASGRIRHSLVVVALCHFDLLQRGLK